MITKEHVDNYFRLGLSSVFATVKIVNGKPEYNNPLVREHPKFARMCFLLNSTCKRKVKRGQLLMDKLFPGEFINYWIYK